MADPIYPVMIFGAGFGTRMQPLTRTQPKPMVAVAGKALIDHALAMAGPRRVVVNTHYLGAQLAAHVGERAQISHESPDILDTGGGLRQALPLLGEGPVLTLNPDAIWKGPNPLDLLEAHWDPARMDALLMMVPPDQTFGFTRSGDFAMDAAGRLSRNAGGLVYSGAQLLHTERLTGVTETKFSLNTVWDQMLAEDRLFGMRYPGSWVDVGTPEGIPLAEAML